MRDCISPLNTFRACTYSGSETRKLWRSGWHALMILAPMKTRNILYCLFAMVLFPSSVYPTTILVLARNGSLYIGADSRRAPEPGSRSVSAETTCKIRKYGAVFVAHYGTVILGIQPKGTHLRVRFDSDKVRGSLCLPLLL